MSIQIVLFDIGGVFLDWKDRWLFRNVAKKFGLSEMRLTHECKKMLPFLRRGNISEQEMWHEVGRNINSDKLPHAKGSLIQDCFRERMVVDSQVIDIVRELQKNYVKTGILSNTTAVMHSVVKEFISMNLFDHQFLSYEMGIEKPDEQIFKHVTEKIPHAKEEILFVDDRQSNIDAAKSFGIVAIRFLDSVHLVKDLKNLEVL